jgi:murein DD-endopeptidase MepM/ murein hydrolase activator NlpD
MDSKKVTILVIGNDDEAVKTIKISANLYHNITTNFRKYVYAASSIIALVLIVIASLAVYTFKVSYDKNGLTNQLTSVSRQLETYDSLRIQQKLNNIGSNLSMIDGYLQERGLIGMENAGGESLPEGFLPNTNSGKIEHFEKQSVIFYNTIKEMPIGSPYDGIRSSDYGYRRNPFGGISGEFHSGVDLKGAVGDPIYATGDGTVERCDYHGGYGNCVVLNHINGYQSLYGHMTSVNVTQGQKVKAGDVVGFLGSTGRSTGPHLHYEIRKDGQDIDPEPFLKLF